MQNNFRQQPFKNLQRQCNASWIKSLASLLLGQELRLIGFLQWHLQSRVMGKSKARMELVGILDLGKEYMSITAQPGISSVDLTTAEVEYSWKVIKPFISQALEFSQGELNAEDIYQGLMYGTMKAWVFHEGPKIKGVCVACPVAYPHFRVCRILTVAGTDFEQWKHFEAHVELYAKALNCQFIDALGRPGWKLFAKQLGYSPQYTTFRKRIHSEVH
jgi:hypothetical protein